MTKNILIVGVGGQGTLLASKIIGEVLLRMGFDVKVSEIHGMSQRGGSVVTYVRYGEKVYSPIIDKGEADYIISFEQLESARYLEYLKKDGVIITNTQQINPISVISNEMDYPKDIIDKIKKQNIKIIDVDALKIAENLGTSKVVNLILLGIFSKMINDDENLWKEVIKDTVKKDLVDLNLKAFDKGRKI